MVTLTADLKGTIDGIHFTLELHILGGPLALQFKLDDPIPLLKVYNWGSEELHKLIGIGLPDLTGGPWSKIIDIGSPPVGLIPSVWLAPGSSTDAFHMELALNPPIKIGGTANYGGLEITVEPNFSILALYLIYNKAAGGLDFKAKVEIPNQVSKAKAALGAAGESARTQMVSYPFPVPPQSSKSSFQLHYFGLGQRIGPDPVTGVTDPIETIFAQIEDQFKTNDPAEILTGLARNFYKPDRDWFIGAHLTLRNWDLKIIFNDPAMYGVRVACPETPTTFFSGFLFEILYEKLGPNLGVYFGALTLPDTLRRINIDGVILILPGFSIWIYTNGDFRVNVGWPLGQSSIGIQLAELTGKAGFYFAKLRSSDNPGYKPGKGTDFDPIIKFGIGVGVYVSVSVNAGIFSASLDASLTATLQGLLAWKGKEVDGRSEGSSMSNPPDHYWFAGTADLLILIQGSVDFVVIKASVTIKLTASTDMALETGCKTLIYVAAGVEAEASIKIIFFTIHFHFSIQVSHTFIIGSGDKTASINGPVNMPGGTGEIQSPDVAAAQKTLRQLIDRQVASLKRFHHRPGSIRDPLLFDTFAGSPLPEVTLYFALQPTVKYDASPVNIQAIASLIIESPTPKTSALFTAQSPQRETQFELLVRLLVGWLLDRYSDHGQVWSQRFQQVSDALGQGNEPPGSKMGGMNGFANALFAFLQTEMTLSIASINAPQAAALESCAVIPMFPQFQLIYFDEQGDETSVFFDSFHTYGFPGSDYPQAVNAFFQELSLSQLGSAAAVDNIDLFGSPSNSGMAGFVFIDFFLMMARHAVKELHQAALQYEMQANLLFRQRVTRTAAGVADTTRHWSEMMDVVADCAEQLTGSSEYETLMAEFNYAALAGITSRFMLHGLQLPRPDHVPPDPTPEKMRDVPTEGAYRLTGQQFRVEGGQTQVKAFLTINPNVSPPPGWINFDGGTHSKCLLDLPAIPPPSPSPQWQGEMLDAYNPGIVNVAALPPISPHAMNFALKNQIAWQDEGSSLSIFPLPLEILQQSVASPCRVVLSADNPSQSASAFSEGTLPGTGGLLIRFKLERVPQYSPSDLGPGASPAHSGSSPAAKGVNYLPYLYQVSPADDHTRDLIYQALQGDLSQSSLHLMYTDPDSGNLTSETPGKLVFITKTDFATESRAGEVHPYFVETIQQLKALDSLGSQNYAPLADVNGFLWLFWECCVVNGGGYFLYYKTSGNEGIPEAVFQGSDTIEFDMLLLFSALGGSPRSAGGGSIPLTSAANVLVTEAWKSGSALFAQLRDENDLPLLQYQPTYPAGTLGFNLNWKHDALQDAAADIPVGSLYQLFQYSLRDNGDYRHSIWSLPMGPTKAGGGGAASPAAAEEPWEYNEVFPLSRFVKEGSPGTLPNRYQVIHRTAEVGFRMIDVYGNALPGGGRYTFTPQYNDPLIAVSEWPGLNLSYEVLPGNARQADLNVLLRFEPASISPAPGGSPLQSPSGFDPETDKSLVLAALKRYQLIYDQVSDPNVSCHIQSSLMSSATEARVMMVILPQLAAFVAGILLDLQDMLDGGLPPNRTTVLSASIPFSDVVGMAENIAALTVNLRLLREVGQSPDALVDKLPAIATVVSEVPANYQDSTANSAGATGGSPAGGPTSLAVFAANFEKAFSGYDGGVGKLKLMQGQSDKDGFADAHRSALWVWRLSPDNGTGFTFSPDFVFLGIRPLSNRLMTRVVSDITYTGVDLDAWARDFLQLMDTAFDPSVAAGMILYDQLKGTSFYNQLTGYRESLAGRIPAGIVTLFEEQAGQGDPDLAAKQLTQVLLQKLSAAYTISTIVQVPAEVHDSATASPVTTDYTPRLQGSVEVPQSGPLSPQSPGKSGEAQQFTFSSSKLALAAGRQWLNFLLSVKDPSAQTFLELPLQYRVNYMQAGFEPEKAHQAFIPSSWLKFAIAGDPLLQPMLTDDPVRIPVPLRVDPQPPTLVQQSGLGLPLPPRTSPHDIEADIREALRWEYRSRIAHSWSHQDELFLTVTYNQPIGDLSDNAGDPREQLFDALAALRQSPTTNPDWLKPLTAMAVSEDHATVDIGDLDGNLKDFLALVQNIAGAWPDYDPSGIRSNLLGPAGLTRHDFRVSYDLNDPRSILVGGRWQQGIELIWPEISDAKSQHAQPGPIVPGQSPDPQGSPEWAWEKRLYTFAEIPDLSELDFLWQPLNILDVQTADTSAYVVRNDNLVPGKTTNPLFVYQTAEVNYTNPTIPLIEHDHLDPLAAGTTLTASLEAILNPLMQVGTVVDALLRLEIGYGFNVAPPASQPLMANSRMLLADGIRIGSAASAGFPQKLASELAAWYRHMRPSTRNGELTIQLFLFANVEGQELPLVILRDIPLQTGTSDGWWQ